MGDPVAIDQLVDDLPTDGVTVRMLQALDFAVPGQWKNHTKLDDLIRDVSGETDPGFIFKVHVRVVKRYNEASQGYQKAMWVFQAVDSSDKLLGAASLASKVGEKIGFLKFLSKITPKADKTQALDLTLKIAAEIVTFCQINGLPGDSIGDFLKALKAYERESAMRMGALVCVDGLIPLGPDFASVALNTVKKLTTSDLEGSGTYHRIKGYLPGAGTAAQLGFLNGSLDSVQDWMKSFTASRGLTPQTVTQNLSKWIEGADQKLDYLAGFLDLSTNYFEHTGTQSIARALVERSLAEM